MRLAELVIDVDRLARVTQRTSAQRHVNGAGSNGRGRGTGVVSAEVIADALGRHEGCRCAELGLEAGMPARELVFLGSGCTGETIDGRRVNGKGPGGWVCPALDTIRRRYGL